MNKVKTEKDALVFKMIRAKMFVCQVRFFGVVLSKYNVNKIMTLKEMQIFI